MGRPRSSQHGAAARVFHGLGMIPRQTGENQKCLQLLWRHHEAVLQKAFQKLLEDDEGENGFYSGNAWIYWAMLRTMALTKDSMKVPPGVVGVHHHNRDWCRYRRQPPSAIGFATSNRCRLTCPPKVPRSRSGHGKFLPWPLHKAILCRSFNEKLAKDSDLLGPITPFIAIVGAHLVHPRTLTNGGPQEWWFGKVNPSEIWPFLGIPG